MSDFEYPTDPEELVRAIEIQEGPPEKCYFVAVVIATYKSGLLSGDRLRGIIEDARTLRETNMMVDGVPYSIHSEHFVTKKEMK